MVLHDNLHVLVDELAARLESLNLSRRRPGSVQHNALPAGEPGRQGSAGLQDCCGMRGVLLALLRQFSVTRGLIRRSAIIAATDVYKLLTVEIFPLTRNSSGSRVCSNLPQQFLTWSFYEISALDPPSGRLRLCTGDHFGQPAG